MLQLLGVGGGVSSTELFGAWRAFFEALSATGTVVHGDRAGATAGYREALRRYRELRLDLDAGYLAIDMVYVLGPSDPLVVEAVAAARTTFAHNARTFLDQLDAALAHGAHAAGEAPARQAREAVSRSGG